MDDELLVNLFIEKIKLTFEADKSSEISEAEIVASLKREKEILSQLAEIEQANAAVV